MPSTVTAAQIAAVTPLVQAVYDARYGPAHWPAMDQHDRNRIVQFVIDQARKGASEVIAHVDADRKQHTLDPAVVLGRIGESDE